MQCNQTCAASLSDSLPNGLPRNQAVIIHKSQTEQLLVQHSPRPRLVIISEHHRDFSRLSHSPSHHITLLHIIHQLSYFRFILHFDQDLIV